jgi:hypothetical protein
MNNKGQMLLVAVLLLAVLMLSIPVMIFLNGSATKSGTISVKKQKSTAVALEGVAFAEHVLSKDLNTWKNALHRVCPPEFTNSETHAPIVYTGASGAPFSIQCISGDPPGFHVQDYEIELLIHGGIQDPAHPGLPSYGRAYKVAVAQKTLALTMATGLQASAALELGSVLGQTSNTGGLVVHWGPIAVFNSAPLSFSNAMDTKQFPRKFSQGQIQGTTFPRDAVTGSDSKEYWSNSSLGFQSVIDTATYASSATYVTNIAPATTLPTSFNDGSTISPQSPNGGPCPNGHNCGYFSKRDANGNISDTVVFGAGGPYTVHADNTVIFIDGNAEFDDVFFDLKHGGGMIITGNLKLNSPGNSGVPLSVRVPPNAASEYPYFESGSTGWPSTGWPCKSSVGSACNSASTGLGSNATNGLGSGGGNGKVFFRGFLYVQGRLIVNPANTGGWLIDGAVRVDGPIVAPAITANGVANAPSLTILYDDEINHAISAFPLELMVDYQKECVPCSF